MISKIFEAEYVGEPEPLKSYLIQNQILGIAHRFDATAIHPGYGFLSENTEFAQRFQDEKLIFVGPPASAIRSMGKKMNLNVSWWTLAFLLFQVCCRLSWFKSRRSIIIGRGKCYWLIIKPIRGGGGKGMRVVNKQEDFFQALESSRNESLKSFKDQSMLIERFVAKPRHAEVQVFGDKHDNYVYLYERDCSVQRRHQKIIEEAPAPLLTDEKRHELGSKAVAAARAVQYEGAGTVEFISDKLTNSFYFMEMNTRLQVEHPISEMVTGTDLVEWQLRVASGQRLHKDQSQIKLSGHALEARVYAEDPANNNLPQTGDINYMCYPDNANLGKTQDPNDPSGKLTIRLDSEIVSGYSISPFYDPRLQNWLSGIQMRLVMLRILFRFTN